MPVEKIEKEGDFVIEGYLNSNLLRLHTQNDEMIITSDEYKGMRTITTISDMREMRDWLTRRLEETI